MPKISMSSVVSSVWFTSVLLPLVVSVGGFFVAAWAQEAFFDDHHKLSLVHRRDEGQGANPRLTYWAEVTNTGDLPEENIELAFRFLRLTDAFDVEDIEWEGSKILLTNQAVVWPTNAAMGSKDYLGDIQRMNPGEWMRFSFRTTKPAAMFAEVRSETAVSQAQITQPDLG
jgi:hypothetical protein